MSDAPIDADNLRMAVRATLDLFLMDAPEMHGREIEIDPAPGDGDEILLTIDGETFAVTIERAP